MQTDVSSFQFQLACIQFHLRLELSKKLTILLKHPISYNTY